MQKQSHRQLVKSPAAEIAAVAIIMVFGFALFLGFGGAVILPVQNISWIKGGDPEQHLLGWFFYRQTDLLQWPVGAISDFGELTAGSVVFSDSLPLFAVFFRLLDSILPDTFQYFGLWILCCFLLQGVFGFWLLRLLSVPVPAAAAGACLLLASPYMLWRLHGHESLIGHWILLAAVCLYLKPRMMWLAWAILLVVAVAVHAYLAAMAGGVWGARLWLERRTPVATAQRAGITFAATAAVAWALGYFMIPGAYRGMAGFGTYRTTLTSWIDPADMWSRLLPELPVGPGDGTYEGFAYLGLGVLLVVLLAGMLLVLSRARQGAITGDGPQISVRPLILLCIAYSLFALSDRISAFGVMLVDVSVLEHLPVVSTFRASGRFIWLPSYVLAAFAIAWVARAISQRMAMPVLAIAAIVQVTDLTHAMRHFRDRFATPVERQFVAPFWERAGERYERIAAWPVDPHSRPVFEASFVAARHGMSIDQAYLARWSGDAFTQTRRATRSQLQNGTLREDTLYLLHDANTAEIMAKRIADLELDAFFAAIDGVWVIAPFWTGCRAECGAQPDAPPQIAREALPADGVLTLSDGGNFDAFAQWGWSEGEETGRWTDGPFAIFSFALEDQTSQALRVMIEAQPLLGGSLSAQQVQVFANGSLLLTQFFNSNEPTKLAFEIPPEIIGLENQLEIELRMPNAATPLSLGLSDDPRELGLYISTIVIRSSGT